MKTLVKNPEGHPPKYKSPEELQKKILDYFQNPPDTRPIYNKDGDKIADLPVLTITGLVIHCGFADRQSFYDYEKNPKFAYTIKRARIFIEREYEILLQKGLGAGAIFALKNFGWKNDDFDFKIENHNHFTNINLKELNLKAPEELLRIAIAK